jgi:type IV pilus assembly protein PilV
MDRRFKRASLRRQSGSSMIEVLVSVLLVSIGLLGIAGLSGATFGYNKVGQMRLTGIALVNDFTDRARINVYGYDLRNYDIAIGDDFQSTPVTVSDTNLTTLDPSNEAQAQTLANDLAAADVDQFLRAVSSRLPQGDAIVISRPNGTRRDMDVWLLWIEPQTGNDVDADRGDLSLFNSAQANCPGSLTTAQRLVYSCMYFKTGL